MLTIDQAVALIRKPSVLSDDRRLREILASVYEAGRDSVVPAERFNSHGIIAFNDGTVVPI